MGFIPYMLKTVKNSQFQGTFGFLDAWNPGFQKCPGIGQFWLISTCRVLIPLSLCQETWFSTQNFKISSFLETSRNFLELWISPGNGQLFANFDILGVNSAWFLSLNLNLALIIEKCHAYDTSGNFLIWIPGLQKWPGIG